jgi:transposase-like protein
MEAMRLRELGYTNPQIAEKLNIAERDRVKVWWRNYRKDGETAFIDKRGLHKESKDTDSYFKRLEMENAFLEILNDEGRKLDSR